MERSGPSDGGATAINEMDTDMDRDARSIFERSQKANEDRKVGEGSDPKASGSYSKEHVDFDDNVYRGVNNYAKFIERKDTAAGSAAKMSTGPQRAPSNIRSTVRYMT